MIIVPSSEVEWQRRAQATNILGGSIHEAKLRSASKIGDTQYLLLRVLWKIPSRGKSQTIPNIFGLADWVQKATPILGRYESWREYCESFHKAKIPEGTFALPRFYQKQAAQVPKTTELPGDSDVVFTPVSNRTRGQVNLISRIRELGLETPSKAPRRRAKTAESLSDEELNFGPDEEDEGEILGLIHPKTKDEQIVNTALIDFLNAFIIHENMPVQWTLYRKPFKAEFKDNSFEARTDGCLEI
ncbi:uncharacterized protein N7483_000284 [Penicillium malachiteum]|uniref:uncharacterized protein n=1 Tax=Penicillium malachiteum TaxID=1324776 RepID=UPI0025497053|nr:uncharacterized protein N7483_000284 [Penicillium malachiteum]KAJ5735159.1 hypothetical protein N7483_000284 [Penicillium malachiteum]